MSRIGKQPIIISDKAEVKIDGNLIVVKGPKGELKRQIHEAIEAKIEDSKILVAPKKESGLKNKSPHQIWCGDKKVMALWGLTRALIFNMVKGIVDGYEKKLEIEGIGFKAVLQGEKLIMNLGFSHPVEFEAPKGIGFKVEKNVIIISGADKESVGQVAASIRALKKPEPYKGKGIHYQGEVIKRKAGKKAVSTST